MTLGVTGVVWFPRTATVNSSTLLAGAGPTPLAAASGAWQSVAAAYADTAITVGRVMAVLAAGWEGDAANAAQARLGGFLAWTQGTAATATRLAALAAGEAAAYTTAAVTMPSPAEILAVKAAKATAYSTGGALNGSAEALEVTDRMLDMRAGLVMEAYEAATTPLASNVSFDRPPEIVNDGGAGSTGSTTSARGTIAESESYEETSIFGFGAQTSPAQAALAAVGSALQNPALASAASQVASTAGSVAGSSVTTVASAATNIGSAAASTLMNSTAPNSSVQNHSSSSTRMDVPAKTHSASAGSLAAGAFGAGGALAAGSAGKTLGGPIAGSAALLGGGHAGVGAHGSGVHAGMSGAGMQGVTGADGALARGAHAGAPITGAHPSGDSEDEHETPGYLKQFEHFADGRTVAPSVIGADPSWNDR